MGISWTIQHAYRDSDEEVNVPALADVAWAYTRLGARDEAIGAARTYLNEVNARRLEDDAFNLANMKKITMQP